jgi:hypothetical protein
MAFSLNSMVSGYALEPPPDIQIISIGDLPEVPGAAVPGS